MQDFNEFERRMRFQFTFANERKNRIPSMSNQIWKPPVTHPGLHNPLLYPLKAI